MSQIKQHAAYGGVVPEIAARAHVEVLDRLIARAVATAGMTMKDIDAVAGRRRTGADRRGSGRTDGGQGDGDGAAQAVSSAVNHLEAHALTARLTDGVAFPYLLLLVSGGHTQLVAVRGVGDYVRLGATLDDAVGEAFDKVAKLLGLPYPGGPLVERHAAEGDPERYAFPRPLAGRPKPDFSLSGLKTAVRIEAAKAEPLNATDVNDICASFQAAVVDMIIDRVRVATKLFREKFGPCSAIVAAGGVAANDALRRAMARYCGEAGVTLVIPPPKLCTDNGAMIAWAGIERLGSEPRRRHDLRRAAALAAGRQRGGGAPREGLTTEERPLFFFVDAIIPSVPAFSDRRHCKKLQLIVVEEEMIDATANSDPPRPQARLTTRRSVLWTLASVGGVGIAGSGLYSVAAGFSDPTAIRDVLFRRNEDDACPARFFPDWVG